jgi:SOUL heme-binding protein
MPNLFKAIVVSALSVIGIRTEQQPAYTVKERVGEIEIRQYTPRFAAETTVDAADDSAARSEGFNILAGYIFGKNHDKREIAMTAPVETSTGRKIDMTAPVETSAGQAGKMTMRFFLPADVAPSNAPVPNDSRVRLVEIPAQTMAVLRFSGSWTVEAITEKQNELLAKLKGTKWVTFDRPFTLFYDPPFTLPPLRRNEAAVLVRVGS